MTEHSYCLGHANVSVMVVVVLNADDDDACISDNGCT